MTGACTEVHTQIVYGPAPHDWTWWMSQGIEALLVVALLVTACALIYSIVVRRRGCDGG